MGKRKEKSELIQEALDTLQAVTLSGRSTEGYVAELFENIRNLEEENKKLKIEIGGLMGERDGKQMRIDELEEKNKKLRDYADNLDSENDNQAIEIEELKEKVRFLEECLDRKEKLNEEYRKEIDELKELNEDIKEIEKNQEYRYHRCMKAERQVQHSLGGDDEEGLYD